jgi:hypothetical protein
VEELVKKVAEKAGINPEQAQKAVHSVIEFVKEKAPMIGVQLKGVIDGQGGLGGIAGKLGDLFGKKG